MPAETSLPFLYQKDASAPTTTEYISSQILTTFHFGPYHSLVVVLPNQGKTSYSFSRCLHQINEYSISHQI